MRRVRCVLLVTLALGLLISLGIGGSVHASGDNCLVSYVEDRPRLRVAGEPTVRGEWRWWPPGIECHFDYEDGVVQTRYVGLY